MKMCACGGVRGGGVGGVGSEGAEIGVVEVSSSRGSEDESYPDHGVWGT